MTDGEEKKSSLLLDSFKEVLGRFSYRPENRQYIIFRAILLCVAALLVGFNWYLFERKENYQIGLPAQKTYFALTSARYEDKAATLELRQRATSRIIAVMVQDEKIASEVSRRIELLKDGRLTELFNAPLLNIYNKQSAASQKAISEAVASIGPKVLNESADREQQTSLIWKYLKQTALTQSERNVAFQMLDVIMNPSLQSDSEMLMKLKDDVAAQIPAVIKEIRPGSVLVQKGEVVTPSTARLLASQGYPDADFPWRHLIFVLGVIIVWSFWPVWISSGLKEKLSMREWIYIAVVLSVVWTLEVVFARLGGYSMAVLGLTGWLCLTMPVSLSFHVIFGGGLISVIIGYGTNPGVVCLGCILAGFSGGIGRIMFLNPPNHRITIWRNLFLLGIALGVVSVCVYWGLDLYFDRNIAFGTVLFSAIWATIVVALLPLWENIFDVISPLRLLELSHPSQPLIKRLQMEAPGTYNHVLMVGTLAEAAADKLHMNGLYVKAGAYYHDIGKLKNPQYFVENQRPGKNIHDSLPPELSAKVLISHVKDGLDIAAQTNLPKALRPFIREHHGTTIQKYFYEKAKALGEDVKEEDFRYPGPRPQTRETALVMLADSVEAAIKARNKPFESDDELSAFIRQVIQSKVDAGQMNDADFTLREIANIEEAFLNVFRSTYHSREVKDINEIIKEARRKRGGSETAKEDEKNENDDTLR
ncbi:HD family phosphohydrolase [uncultured Cloacibacillus sp.]|uniref:HD family phosphohydrolase n=1 Tax=uncultured Cloacibacillus sp. TaxID=889794 RepID=UPI001F883128|nr:HDIG domain-containing metalloprotein [uncultured Cloacibacillus sp.]HIR17448.1 HDIG domain-containing protein [Candidatus Caccocola faecigallinarum]